LVWGLYERLGGGWEGGGEIGVGGGAGGVFVGGLFLAVLATAMWLKGPLSIAKPRGERKRCPTGRSNRVGGPWNNFEERDVPFAA